MKPALSPAIFDDAGFTLLELLIAMTLLGFLSLLLFGGLKLGTRVWERSETMTADANTIRSVQQTLADQIRSTYPLFRQLDATHAAVAFEGSPHAMSFLTTVSSTPGSMKRIGLAVRQIDDTTSLIETATDELSTLSGTKHVLLERLAFLTLDYFGRGDGEKNPSWHNTWREQTHLPKLVRLRAAFRDHSLFWPDLIVAPRITADEGCIYDPLTSDCQGRL